MGKRRLRIVTVAFFIAVILLLIMNLQLGSVVEEYEESIANTKDTKKDPLIYFDNGTIDWAGTMNISRPSKYWEMKKHIDVDPVGLHNLPDPKTHIVSYAEQCCRYSRIMLRKSLQISKLDSCTIYNKEDLDQDFIRRNDHILSQKRGVGYWIWKPYVILKKILDPSVRYGDFVFWVDVAMYFTDNGTQVVEAAIKQKKHMMLFSTMKFFNYIWIKRDAWVYLDMDNEKFYRTIQIDGSKSLWRKTDNTILFLKEWLYWVQNSSVVTDAPNVNGLPNIPGFVENRHDQAVLALLQLKHDVEPHRDISQSYNEGTIEYTEWIKSYGPDNSPWQQVVLQHRDKT